MSVKILHIYGDEGFAVTGFLQSPLAKVPIEDVYIQVLAEGGSLEDEEYGYIAECYEFEGAVLTPALIAFLQNQKDYDQCKDDDWFIVDSGA